MVEQKFPSFHAEVTDVLHPYFRNTSPVFVEVLEHSWGRESAKLWYGLVILTCSGSMHHLVKTWHDLVTLSYWLWQLASSSSESFLDMELAGLYCWGVGECGPNSTNFCEILVHDHNLGVGSIWVSLHKRGQQLRDYMLLLGCYKCISDGLAATIAILELWTRKAVSGAYWCGT